MASTGDTAAAVIGTGVSTASSDASDEESGSPSTVGKSREILSGRPCTSGSRVCSSSELRIKSRSSSSRSAQNRNEPPLASGRQTPWSTDSVPPHMVDDLVDRYVWSGDEVSIGLSLLKM